MIFPLSAAALLLIGAMCGQDPAAQTPPAPQTQSTAQPTGTAKRSKKAPDGSSKDRLFFALPNFMTLENAANAPPLTAGQKFKLTAQGTFDPMQLVFYGAQAGLNQAQDHDAQFGQGTEGYAKRYGVILADGTIENFMTRAILPSVLHQDPRYFQLGEGGFLHRAFYAINRLVVTRSDSGSTQFNFSEMLGSSAAAGIGVSTYHPSSDRSFSNFLQVWCIQLGWDALSNGLKEFWPDMRRKMTKSKSGKAAPQTNPPAGPGH